MSAVDIRFCVLRNDAIAAFRKGSTQSPQMHLCGWPARRQGPTSTACPILVLVAEGIDGSSLFGPDLGPDANVAAVLGPND